MSPQLYRFPANNSDNNKTMTTTDLLHGCVFRSKQIKNHALCIDCYGSLLSYTGNWEKIISNKTNETQLCS